MVCDYRKCLFCGVVLFIINQSISFADNHWLYCYGELDYGDLLKNQDWREYQTPKEGYLQVYSDEDDKYLKNCLPSEELRYLKILSMTLGTGKEDFFEQYSTFYQISRIADHKTGKKHITALCFSYISDSEMWLPVIRIRSNKTRIDVDIQELRKFTRLKYLELYSSYDANAKDFVTIKYLTNLEYLGMPCNTQDKHLQYISGLKYLQFLNCSNTKITGEGLACLSALPDLHILDLRRNSFSEGSLAKLRNCDTIRTLLLSETNVTAADLKSLEHLTNLEYLTLHNTPIGDDIINIISPMKHLKYISLYETKVSENGLTMLHRMRPDIKIESTKP